MTKDYLSNHKELLRIDEILIPDGIEITVEEILNNSNPDPIEVDKENVIQCGINSYLLAVKNGDNEVPVIRTSRLQKINIGLDSAA